MEEEVTYQYDERVPMEPKVLLNEEEDYRCPECGRMEHSCCCGYMQYMEERDYVGW